MDFTAFVLHSFSEIGPNGIRRALPRCRSWPKWKSDTSHFPSSLRIATVGSTRRSSDTGLQCTGTRVLETQPRGDTRSLQKSLRSDETVHEFRTHHASGTIVRLWHTTQTPLPEPRFCGQNSWAKSRCQKGPRQTDLAHSRPWPRLPSSATPASQPPTKTQPSNSMR